MCLFIYDKIGDEKEKKYAQCCHVSQFYCGFRTGTSYVSLYNINK